MDDNDILTKLNVAILKTDDYLRVARRLRQSAAKLPQEALKGSPEFADEWTPEALDEHIQRLGNWIRDPLRAKNRTVLQNLGVLVSGIPPETFDDSEGVEEIQNLLGEVASIDKSLNQALLDGHVVGGWLIEGTRNTVQRLANIVEAKEGFKRLLSSNIPQPLMQPLVLMSLKDTSFIPSAETVAAKVGALVSFGISMEPTPNLDEFMDYVTSTHGVLQALQDEYKIPKETLCKQTDGKSLHEAKTLLDALEKNCIDQKEQLLQEWNIYFAALSSIGAKPESVSPPRAIPALRHQIDEFREQCLKSLGEEGMALFQFMKGEGEFPEKISVESVKKALEALRPLIIMSLKKEDQDAEG